MGKAKPAPIRAFIVSDDGEQSEIVFARHAISAKRRMMDEWGCDLAGLSCHRAGWADQYAEVGVPASVLVYRGWWFEECTGCGCPINNDALAECGKTAWGVLGTSSSAVFCDADCEAAYKVESAAKARCGERALTRLRAVVARRFPGVEFGPDKHVYVTRRDGKLHVGQASVSFDFPGRRIGLATLRADRAHSGNPQRKPYYTCCNGDREAFEAFARATKPTALLQERAG